MSVSDMKHSGEGGGGKVDQLKIVILVASEVSMLCIVEAVAMVMVLLFIMQLYNKFQVKILYNHFMKIIQGF